MRIPDFALNELPIHVQVDLLSAPSPRAAYRVAFGFVRAQYRLNPDLFPVPALNAVECLGIHVNYYRALDARPVLPV